MEASGVEAAAVRAALRREGHTVVQEIERLLTITELSEMLGIPVDTLYGWRHRGQGPRGYRVGRHVRYRRAVSRPGSTPGWTLGRAS